MTDPTLTCPHCHQTIHLSESLAAPLIAATRKQYEARLAQKDQQHAQREAQLKAQEAALAQAQHALEAQVSAKVQKQLATERAQLEAQATQTARATVGLELERQTRQLTELQTLLQQREEKLAQAQQAQADLLKKQRDLDDARRELELTIEQRVQATLTTAREQARREAEESLKLRVLEKDHTIAAMQQKIEELKQRAEQGSQQLQGEVQELELEALLRTRFPVDAILPVPKGEFGGDVLQTVQTATGLVGGLILWESKRTKHWSDGWLSKLRDDQRAAKADIAVIVSHALPKEVESFDCVDGVWVVAPRAVLPLTTLLRQLLLDVSVARQISEGQHSKTELIYQYLTGPRFKQRVQAIVEAFNTMQEDLDKERKVILRQWAKRQEQIERVMQSTVSMYGDLQGIAGKSLQEIEGLAWEALDPPAATDTLF